MKSESAKVLIAMSLGHTPVVLRTNSGWCAWDLEEIGSYNCDDLGIPWCESPTGFCLFEGKMRTGLCSSFESPDEFETLYEGKVRPVEWHELEELMKMSPPEEDFDEAPLVAPIDGPIIGWRR